MFSHSSGFKWITPSRCVKCTVHILCLYGDTVRTCWMAGALQHLIQTRLGPQPAPPINITLHGQNILTCRGLCLYDRELQLTAACRAANARAAALWTSLSPCSPLPVLRRGAPPCQMTRSYTMCVLTEKQAKLHIRMCAEMRRVHSTCCRYAARRGSRHRVGAPPRPPYPPPDTPKALISETYCKTQLPIMQPNYHERAHGNVWIPLMQSHLTPPNGGAKGCRSSCAALHCQAEQ